MREVHQNNLILTPSLVGKGILLTQIQPGTQVILPLDRTQWKQNNLFVVSVIWGFRIAKPTG